MRSISLGIVLLVFGVAFIPTNSNAEVPTVSAEARASAREHNQQGEIQYNLGRFEEALEQYSLAYELFPHPAFLFNLGQCQRELGNFDRAVFFFEGYLRELPEARNRELVEELLTESRAGAEEHRAQAEAEEAARLEAEAQAREAEAARLAAQETNEGDPLESQDILDDDPSETTARRPVYRRWWFWTIIGTVVVGGVTAGLVVGLSNDDPQSVLPQGSAGTVDWR